MLRKLCNCHQLNCWWKYISFCQTGIINKIACRNLHLFYSIYRCYLVLINLSLHMIKINLLRFYLENVGPWLANYLCQISFYFRIFTWVQHARKQLYPLRLLFGWFGSHMFVLFLRLLKLIESLSFGTKALCCEW